MKLCDLQDNQRITFRLGRAGESRVKWGFWQNGDLYLARRETACKGHPAGEILTLAIREVVWAEYGQDDFDSTFNIFVNEDYYLEIQGLEA